MSGRAFSRGGKAKKRPCCDSFDKGLTAECEEPETCARFVSVAGSDLDRIREALRAKLDKGTICPTCDQHARRYKRKLNSDMARALCLIVTQWENQDSEWVDVRDIDVRGGDYAKLRHWGLIRQRINDDETKRTSGMWTPTDLGQEFARNVVEMPTYVFIYNNEVDGFSEERSSIRDALGAGFNYSELMGINRAI